MGSLLKIYQEMQSDGDKLLACKRLWFKSQPCVVASNIIKYTVEIAILIKELFNRVNESRDRPVLLKL